MPFQFSPSAEAYVGLRKTAPRRTEQAALFESLFMQSFVEMRARESARRQNEPEAVNS